MGKYLVAIILGILSSQMRAETCWPLYQAKADVIADKTAVKTRVGAGLYTFNDSLRIWPGTTITTAGPNWAQEFISAIKWGSYYFSNSEDPRKEWLKTMDKSIKKDCPLKDKDFESLRAMMKELMDDGSFCPRGKILEPKAFGNRSEFKKVLKSAVKGGRFAHFCENQSVANDSFRDIKDPGKSKTKPVNHSQSSHQ